LYCCYGSEKFEGKEGKGFFGVLFLSGLVVLDVGSTTWDERMKSRETRLEVSRAAWRNEKGIQALLQSSLFCEIGQERKVESRNSVLLGLRDMCATWDERKRIPIEVGQSSVGRRESTTASARPFVLLQERVQRIEMMCGSLESMADVSYSG
jgi:hypothetical protein